MKYRLIAVVAVLLLLFTFNVSAASYEYYIATDKSLTSVQYGDDLTTVSQKLNMSVDELNTYFNKNGLLYLAVSDDAKTQIKISAFTDNFSSAASDMAYLDDAGLSEFISAVSDSADNPTATVTNNDRKYICVKNTLKDSGGVYTVTQYITICDSKTFYFAGYNEGEETSPVIQSAFESFTLNEVTAPQPNYTLYTVLIIVGIVLFSAVAVVMIIGIIKIKTKKEPVFEENFENEN